MWKTLLGMWAALATAGKSAVEMGDEYRRVPALAHRVEQQRERPRTVSEPLVVLVDHEPPQEGHAGQWQAVLAFVWELHEHQRGIQTLDDSAMAWDSSLAGTLGTGHELDVVLAEGMHTLTVTGTDSHGAGATDQVTVNVVLGYDYGPDVDILEPAMDITTTDLDWQYDGWDAGAGMLYKDVTLIGSADDPEDGMLTGASMVWTTDRTDLQPAVLGTGTTLTVRLYATDPCRTVHTITLAATDSFGNERPVQRIITLWAVC